MTCQFRLSVVLAVIALVLSPARTHAAVESVFGQVESVIPGAIGLTAGAISGSVTYDEATGVVSALSVNLPGGLAFGFADLVGGALVDATSLPLPLYLEAQAALGSVFGFTGVELFSNGSIFFGGTPGTFEILADPFGTTRVATGSLRVTPLPAALPLLAAAIGGLAMVAHRPGRRSARRV